MVLLLESELDYIADFGRDGTRGVCDDSRSPDHDINHGTARDWDDCKRKTREGGDGCEFGHGQHFAKLEREWRQREREWR
jgi:hypothetical protein